MKPALQHRQLHQRLNTAHEGATVVERILVVQRHRLQGAADVFGQGRVHEKSPVLWARLVGRSARRDVPHSV